jgi:hypothetical protein
MALPALNLRWLRGAVNQGRAADGRFRDLFAAVGADAQGPYNPPAALAYQFLQGGRLAIPAAGVTVVHEVTLHRNIRVKAIG